MAWADLPAWVQDALTLTALLLPAAAVGWAVNRGYRTGAMTRALLWRFRATNLLFVVLIALSVGLGIAVIAQERALRQGTARAAAKFDVIVAVPGDRIRMLLAAVYLQPSDAPLLRGALLAELQADPQIDLLAPIAFGDSFQDAPIVGTTADFVTHLSGALASGRMFAASDEAVAGDLAPVEDGTPFTPLHGHGDAAEDLHGDNEITVVGRMNPTGSPWDRAILVPIENIWKVHGLAFGHAPESADQIGPPFDPDFFPGTPAFLLHSDEIWDNYAVQARYDNAGSMAFFPGAVLAQLHSVLGDVREMMSLMAVLTQVLVAAGVLAGLVA
jgi:putative ABC transport system permease protein